MSKVKDNILNVEIKNVIIPTNSVKAVIQFKLTTEYEASRDDEIVANVYPQHEDIIKLTKHRLKLTGAGTL